MKVFTAEDYLFRLCTKEEIGTPWCEKPIDPEPESDLSLKELRNKAVALALQTPRFFEDDPTFHKRFLLAIAKSNEPTGTEALLTVNISWLNPDRLSYKHGPTNTEDMVQDVSPKDLVEPSPTSAGAGSLPPTTGTWKPVEPENLGINSLLHEIKP